MPKSSKPIDGLVFGASVGAWITLSGDQLAFRVNTRLTQGLADELSLAAIADSLSADTAAGTLDITAQLETQMDTLAASAIGVAAGDELVASLSDSTLVEWVCQEDACEECAPYDGWIGPVDDAPDDIPVHPNCMCALVDISTGAE
jgi:hypothetical protein